MTIALLFSLGTCIVQVQTVQVDFTCTKGLFNLSTEAIINVRNARLCARCAIFLLKIKEVPFSCRLINGVYIFEESPKSVQDVIGDVFCRSKFCSNRQKCDSRDGYVTTPRSIYGCGKCGAWLFNHEIPFMLQEHVKRTKTDSTRSLLKEDELGTEQTIVTQCSISINQIKKERIVCGQQCTRDHWRFVFSKMYK